MVVLGKMCREYGTLLACDPQWSTFKLSCITWVSKNYQNSNQQICSARHRWKIWRSPLDGTHLPKTGCFTPLPVNLVITS